MILLWLGSLDRATHPVLLHFVVAVEAGLRVGGVTWRVNRVGPWKSPLRSRARLVLGYFRSHIT